MLSVKQASEQLGLKPATVRKLVADRRLEVVRINRRVLIKPESVDALISKCTIPVKPEGRRAK